MSQAARISSTKAVMITRGTRKCIQVRDFMRSTGNYWTQMRRPDLVVNDDGETGAFRIREKSLGPARRKLVNRRPFLNLLLGVFKDTPYLGRVLRLILQEDSMKHLKPGDIYEIKVDMNGFKSKDITVTVKGTMVHVRGQYDHVSIEDKLAHYVDREFTFPDLVDTNFVQAVLQHDGLLRLTAPIVALPEEKEKTIPVKQLPPPEEPAPPPLPNRESFAMECEICGPYGFKPQARPGETHLSEDCRSSTKKSWLRSLLSGLFVPTKRPKELDMANGADPESPTSGGSGGSSRFSAQKPPEGGPSPPRKTDSVSSESSTSTDSKGSEAKKSSSLFERYRLPRLSLPSIKKSASPTRHDAATNTPSQPMRSTSEIPQGSNAKSMSATQRHEDGEMNTDGDDYVSVKPTSTSIRDDSVWEKDHEQFNLDAFLNQPLLYQKGVHATGSKSTMETNPEYSTKRRKSKK